MDLSWQIGDESGFHILWEDGEVCLRRQTWRGGGAGYPATVLVVLPQAKPPSQPTLDRLSGEFGFRDELDRQWAVRPLELQRDRGRIALVLEDPGGGPLAGRLGVSLAIEDFLALAIGMAEAVGGAHRAGLIHKDIKPANLFVGCADGNVRLTGFGIASRLPRERQAPGPPETISGTLAYMAPEQTGRTNRSVDTRSDLYALGVTFYEMLTATSPFTATDPVELMHCHIARRPVPPSEVLPDIPAVVSAIVLKLLAKTPEERYQTAGGLKRDLQRCLDAWQAGHRIDDFPLGQRDTPDRLLVPEKLYGRERESAAILGCFERVVQGHGPELLLVSGYSGIGKSAVVHELQKALVLPRALFAFGKFDQYQRDIPYATLVQALQKLVLPLLSKGDAELAGWRRSLQEALGPNGRLMTDLIPELKLIIGEPPPAPDLPSHQIQSRFNLVFQRFVSVFARPEHPLALFLDDLQWLDMATLDLLEDILARPDSKHLLLIGAYRDNEVGPNHPLLRKLEAVRSAGGKGTELRLAPLGREHMAQMLADTLRCEPGRTASLVRLVQEKTGGNPFFVLQFLSLLAQEGMVAFDHERSQWIWDTEQIRAQHYTDNIVDLMVEKLGRLSGEAQSVLQQLSCLGSAADVDTLALVLGIPREKLDAAMWPARRLEIVDRVGGSYRFTHDRIREAAYRLIPEGEQAQAHVRIGRLLAAHTPPEVREEAIFDIVNQLNRGISLIRSPAEREQLAEFNLIAGKRAKRSAAYASALTYFETGAALLPRRPGTPRLELGYALDLLRAECEFLNGAPEVAEARFEALRLSAVSLVELSFIARLRGEIFVTLDRIDRAVEVSLDYLRQVGIDWSPRPTPAEVQSEHQRLGLALAASPIGALGNGQGRVDPEASATMDVLLQLAPAAVAYDDNLLCLTVCRMGNLSLASGNSDQSCSVYMWLGMVLGPYLGDYRSGLEFARLGLELVEQRGRERLRARAYLLFGAHVHPWSEPVRTARPMLRRAFEVAIEAGDVTFAGYSCLNLITNLLDAGEPLDSIQAEVERALEFSRQHQYRFVADLMLPQLQLVRTLRGLTPEFGSFDDAEFSGDAFRQRTQASPIARCWYWIRTLQANFLAGRYASALDAANRAQEGLWTSTSSLETAEYHYYAGLTRAALYGEAGETERAGHRAAMAAHYLPLQRWAENCPANFADRAALVAAEMARIDERALDTMDLYEKAIRAAQDNGFVHRHALAHELAARFYAGRGFETIARVYAREARQGYLRWGAAAKVRQLEDLMPHELAAEPSPAWIGTAVAQLEDLDLATVTKVLQAISGEIVLDRLIDTLMRTAIEHAGGEKAVLLLAEGAEYRIEAEAVTTTQGVVVHVRNGVGSETRVPESVIRYVARTRESVILDDADVPALFADDRYFAEFKVRSLLCQPLTHQSNLIGLLYIENNLLPRVFTHNRLAVLKLIASQAAISLENTRLYRDVEERESRIRRLVESDVIGILIWDLDGILLDANDAFLRMLQCDRDDLKAGLRWFDMTPPEWQAAHIQEEAEELKATGLMKAREKEFFRKDGSRVPVLIGAAAFEREPNQGVAYVLDLTDLKRAEAIARESEQRYRKVQMELAHANRISTMGQLTGSIAHEVNQPITATVINAQSALRMLQADPPDLGEVQDALESIVKDGNRAGGIIARIRDLIKKAPPVQGVLEINEPILEVIELTRSESIRNSIRVVVELADELPAIRGDRVQLQQVMLNLVFNAIEAMSASGDEIRELTIRTERRGEGEVLVSVRDTGPGLTAAAEESAFEAFYTTKATGLGMGLSICLSILEAHSGRIWVSANHPRGAEFQFSLPAGEGEAG